MLPKYTNEAIFLIDADGDCEELVSTAARVDHQFRWARTTPDAFRILQDHIREFALIIIDVDPGMHGLALLEAINACGDRPPMIVLTALEETYMKPIAQEHGAVACLGKPLEIERLTSTIQNVLENQGRTCDNWGHIRPLARQQHQYKTAPGIAVKLSAPIAARNGSSKRRSRTITNE